MQKVANPPTASTCSRMKPRLLRKNLCALILLTISMFCMYHISGLFDPAEDVGREPKSANNAKGYISNDASNINLDFENEDGSRHDSFLHSAALSVFRSRAQQVSEKCAQIPDSLLESYRRIFVNYDSDLDYESDRPASDYRFQSDRLDSTTQAQNPKDTVYHGGFNEHGPTAVVPAHNLLISVPEKCGSEFWFKIAEYLNFPQATWPKESYDKKRYQRYFMLPMLNNLYGAAEALEHYGATVAVVRHPFLRLYSAYTGFFTATSLDRDRMFAMYWLENSDAFRELFMRHPNLSKTFDELQSEDTVGDIMTFEQFVEGVIIHSEHSREQLDILRWSEHGEAHINPIFAVLMPCQYKYKYYLKLEHMMNESMTLFGALNIDLPREYYYPSHQSVNNVDFGTTIKEAFANIGLDERAELKDFYKHDFDFFGYSIDINTLEIGY